MAVRRGKQTGGRDSFQWTHFPPPTALACLPCHPSGPHFFIDPLHDPLALTVTRVPDRMDTTLD